MSDAEPNLFPHGPETPATTRDDPASGQHRTGSAVCSGAHPDRAAGEGE